MKIIMNPPYDKNLHLKILNEVIKQCKGAEIVNLSPISEVKRHIMFGDSFRDDITHFDIEDIINVEEASKFFGIDIRHDLGIWHISPEINTDWDKLRKQTFSYEAIVKKIYAKIEDDPLYNHLTKKPTGKYFLKFCDGISTYNNGKITASTFRYVSLNWDVATKGCEKGHTKYLNFDNENELRNAWELFTKEFFRWFSRYGLLCQTRYDMMPNFDYTHPWTDADLYKYFGLTDEEIKEIESAFN